MASPLASVRRLSAATLNLLLSRAEFASLELAQTRAQLMRWLVLALLGAVLALLALIAGSALLTLMLWPRYGWVTLAVLVVLYVIGAVWLFRSLAAELAAAPPVLSQTLRELSNDRDAFLGGRGRSVEGDAS
jgi:uncharacterized membrane protein YqjE